MESGGGREQTHPLTAEEEALKRNTDCVYFLASPLTCKKGTECEYRHSEGARVNPRDCWYWLNGNCLNPRCTFRHPPLDGLFGNPGTASALVPPPSQTVAGPAAYNLNKGNVPCYYFQKGHCLKGDKCPFMHGPQQTGNPVPQQVAIPMPLPNPVSTVKKDSWGLKECISHQLDEANVDKLAEMPLAPVKPAAKSENLPDNGFAYKQTTLPYPSEDEPPSFLQSNAPVNGGIALGQPQSHQSQSMDEHLQNGREADESLRESSPGFDVLVDNNVEESDYFHEEGDFRRASVQGGRNLNHVSDFDYRHSDYDPLPSLERDHQYNGACEYDRCGRLDNRYRQEQQRISSDRILDRAPMPEKRVLQGEKSYNDIAGSDLRHQLLKRRRLDISRSALSPNQCSKFYQRDNHARHAHRRILMESSISSRLQGRITLPARSLPDRPMDLQSDRDKDKRRHRGRSSPVRSIKGRYCDRLKRRPHEDFSDVRNVGGQPIRREDSDSLNFAGPKSLAELKGAKLWENFQDEKNLKLGKALGHQGPECPSFEGPKPLSVILKRKREPASGNAATSSNEDNNNQKDIEGGFASSITAVTEKKRNYTANCPEESKVTGVDEEEEEGMIPTEEELPNDGQTSAEGNTHEVEDGMTVDAMGDQEMENYGQRDGDSDYEAVEGGEFQPEDENACQEDEEDDEDDFAKKVGAMFS